MNKSNSLVLGLFVILLFVFSGCVSNKDTTDPSNSLFGDSSGLENQTPLELNNSLEVEQSENPQATYCYATLGEVIYEYYFAKDVAVMKASVPGSWTKMRIDLDFFCSWDKLSGVAPQCSSVIEAGGFSTILSNWLTEAKVMGDCEEVAFDELNFEMP